MEKRTIDFRYAPAGSQFCIGLVDDEYKTLVADDGSLCFGFSREQAPRYFTLMRSEHSIRHRREQNNGFLYRYMPVILHKDALLSRSQDFGNPAAAIVTTTEEYVHSTLSWKAFAWRTESGARADVIRWKLAAKENFTRTRALVALDIRGEEGGCELLYAEPVKTVSPAGDSLASHLAAGECIEGAFFLVHEGELDQKEKTLEGADAALRWCERYWNAVKPFQNAFHVPDSAVMDMLASCGRNILQAREIKEGVYTYQVGPTVYRGLWIVDGHFLLESVHMMGRNQEAYDGMLAVLHHVKPSGEISVNPLHIKETGIAMATFVRQCEIMNDDGRLAELWPTIRRGLGYIRQKRSEAMAMGEEYRGYGMFPPAMGDGGINAVEPEYTSVLWTLYGLKEAYRAGKRLNLPEYEEFAKTYDELMAAFRKAAERDMRVTADGIAYVPMSMLTDDEYREYIKVHYADMYVYNQNGYRPQTGTWALAQAITPGEVFAPDDPIVTNFLALLDSVDNTEGIPENTGWMTGDALWAYNAMFDAQVWLYAGKGEKAIDYLYAFANHASPGRAWREEQSLRDSCSSEGCGDMPHNWGSAEFIRLVRNSVIFEKCGDLELLAALPVEWLPREGEDLVIERSPTRYGMTSLRLSWMGQGAYRIAFERETTQQPETLRLHWKGTAELDVPAKQGDDEWLIEGTCAKFGGILRL